MFQIIEAAINHADCISNLEKDIFGKNDISYENVLSDYKINLHSLCTWKDIIDLIKIKKLYSTKQITSLENFLYNPEKWREEL